MHRGPIDEKDKEKDKETLILNVKYIVFYALSFAIAFAINDVATSIFASFPNNQHIITKITYVVILFGITIYLAYISKDIINR